jgi:heat-inducible transcriptional repressor
VAVVQYPSMSRSTVRHVEFVPVGGGRLLVVLITNTGRVEQRIIDVAGDPTEVLLGDLRARVNAAACGRRLTDVHDLVADLPKSFDPDDRPLVVAVLDALSDTLDIEREERLILAGTANLARSGIDFSGSISPVLEALEEQMVLLKLLSEMAEDGTGIGVRIGREHVHLGLTETAVVASSYASAGENVARLGVLGPTRMDYPTTIAAVRAVARYVSRILTG